MAKQKQLTYEADDEEVRPAKIEILPEELEYPLEPFTPISESATDQQTTAADLQHLNNHLAVSAAMLPNIRTLMGLCALSATVCKLIETRRKVKKLAYGEPAGGKSGKTFEIVE